MRSFVRRVALLWILLAALTAPAEAGQVRIPLLHGIAYATVGTAGTTGGGKAATSPTHEPAGHGMSGLMLVTLLAGGVIFGAVRGRLGHAVRSIRPLLPTRRPEEQVPTGPVGPGFEARVAARLAEIERDAAQAAMKGAPKGFGRKTG